MYIVIVFNNEIDAAVAKLVKAPDFQSGDCGFDPRRLYKLC